MLTNFSNIHNGRNSNIRLPAGQRIHGGRLQTRGRPEAHRKCPELQGVFQVMETLVARNGYVAPLPVLDALRPLERT